MKRFTSVLLALAVFFSLIPQVLAATIYLPTESSSEYLPTVKIFAYSLSYDGNLVAEGYGSGTLIDSNGVILTNNHVVEDYWDPTMAFDAFQICLTKSNNPKEPICEFTASLITRDPDRDLALLKMDSRDVRGANVVFDFYLPYGGNYNIGDNVTVIGYPDTGGKTITYTSGLISGIVTENGVDYIKTDADISFGNSGGSAVDKNGNLVGVPTYIVGSYSSEVLGYFFPVKDALSWIDSNKGAAVVKNEVAQDKLVSEISAYINANVNKKYTNDYPAYSISIVDGWKFGNSLEGAFEEQGFYYDSYAGADSITIYPEDRDDSSLASLTVSAEKFPYEITLDDIKDLQNEYYGGDSSSYYDEYSLEEVSLNGEYPSLKETTYSYDWYTGEYLNTVTYYIVYGDYMISIYYNYTDSETGYLTDIEKIMATFAVDMDAIELSVVEQVVSTDPAITIKNPLTDGYLSDESYEYDGVNYFGASFGKKDDLDFYVSVYSNTYWDEAYVGDFEGFEDATLADAEEWYEIIGKGNVTIDSHKGFYYIEEYDSYDYTSYYLNVYLEYDDDSYITVYYSGNDEAYKDNMSDFRKILKAIKLTNGGEGAYVVPLFSLKSGNSLKDIENYVYESNIKALDKKGVFGEGRPSLFNPGAVLTREDFVTWAVKNADGDLKTEFDVFAEGEIPESFDDVDYDSENAKYIEFAKSKGVVSGQEKAGKTYFNPDEPVTLSAGLKIVFKLYDYKVWKSPEFLPWYVPYIQLGYQQGLIPYGVSDVYYVLTRGEGAFIIDQAYYMSTYSDYYYDDYWY